MCYQKTGLEVKPVYEKRVSIILWVLGIVFLTPNFFSDYVKILFFFVLRDDIKIGKRPAENELKGEISDAATR